MKRTTLLLTALLAATALSAQDTKGVHPINQSTSQPVHQTRAVVVGISDYEDAGIPDLRFAHRDAEAFANFLRSPGGGSLGNDHLKLLFNEQATAGQVIAALTWLLDESKPGDQAIIYFSGHGDVEAKLLNQLGFLLLWDSPAHAYLAGALPVDMLRQVVSTLSIEQKTKVFVVVDACRAGKLAGNTVVGTQLTGSQLAQQFSQEQKVLSCQPDEFSIEGEQWGGGRGVFSYHLCNGLYGMADGDRDGQVSLFEIGRYLEDRVPKEVSPLSQLPLTVGDKSGVLFPVDGPTLAVLEKQGAPPVSIAQVEQRGMLQEVLAKADTSVRFWYAGFERTLRRNHFFEPEGACAEFFFQKLMATESVAALRPMLKRNYAAALQDDAQQAINALLKADIDELSLSRINKVVRYQPYPRHLARAAELLGEKHYLYRSLLARKYYFEAGLLRLSVGNNKNIEAGRRILVLLEQALELEPNSPHIYLQKGQTFGYQLREPDSARLYFVQAAQLAPSWFIPHTFYAEMLGNIFGKPEMALQVLDAALAIDSNAIEVQNIMGMTLRKLGRLKEAERYYLSAIEKKDPAVCYPCVYSNLALVYKQTGRFDDAEKMLKKALEEDSTATAARTNLAALYMMERPNLPEAEKLLRAAIQLDTTHQTASMNLGLLLHQMGRDAEAEVQLLAALKLDSTNADVLSTLAAVYANLGRVAEAEKMALKGIGLNPQSSVLQNRLGETYKMSNRPKEAEQAYKKAIQLDSTFADAYNNLGALYTDALQRYEEAEPLFLKANQLDPANAHIRHENLGILYLRTRRWAEAEQQFKKVLERDSTIAVAHYSLGMVYSSTGRPEKAEEQFKKSLQLAPKDPDLCSGVAYHYLGIRSYDASEELFKNTLQLDTMHLNARIGLGILYASTQRYMEAELQMKKALQISPNNFYVLMNLGIMYKETDRPVEAEQYLLKALNISPNNPSLNRHLAAVYLKTTRYAEAEQALKKIILANGADTDAHYDLTCVQSLQGRLEEAFQSLEKAIKNGYNNYDWMQEDSDLAPLRALPEWKALMKKHFPDKVKD